jgi:hypothetical protein
MSVSWINCSVGLWPAIAAALAVSLASLATGNIGRTPRRMVWRRKVTIELRVRVSGSRRTGG